MSKPLSSRVTPYLLGLLFLSLATAARMVMMPWIDLRYPFLTFFIAVMGAAWYGGLGPGLVASVLSILIANYYFIEPLHLFAIEKAGTLPLTVFALEVAGVSYLAEQSKRKEADLEKSQMQLRLLSGDLQSLNANLEQRVAVRTSELQESQAHLRALSTELNLAEERERKRVATELHDHLAQLLVLGRLKLGQAKKIPSLNAESGELLRHIDDILTESLSYTRTLVANLSPSVLYEFGLPAAIKWLAEQMQRYDLTVKVQLSEQPPITLPEDQAVLVFQSVRELLMNSAKHAKSSEAKIVLECHQEALRVVVRDYGVGFNLAAAWEPRSSKFGLFSIRERMRALGGSFTLHSQLGEGTTAILDLPIRRKEEITILRGVGDKQPSEPLEADTEHRGLSVLLVDDHAMIRQGLRSVMETYSDIHVVGEACDGVEAVAQADRLCPSVVVMDINMPIMNGIEATAQIKARHPNMVVIGLSVNASSDNQNAMQAAGASMLLTKEAAVEQLYQSIQQAMRGRLDAL
jgi:signal transduction histidine kinase/CheY-like chemotaxis protein